MNSLNSSVNQVNISRISSSQMAFLSDTWLFTNGSNVGIVQLIGQAIRKRKLTKPQDKAVAIAVCNYGCVKNLTDFQRPEHRQSNLFSSGIENTVSMTEESHGTLKK